MQLRESRKFPIRIPHPHHQPVCNRFSIQLNLQWWQESPDPRAVSSLPEPLENPGEGPGAPLRCCQRQRVVAWRKQGVVSSPIPSNGNTGTHQFSFLLKPMLRSLHTSQPVTSTGESSWAPNLSPLTWSTSRLLWGGNRPDGAFISGSHSEALLAASQLERWCVFTN